MESPCLWELLQSFSPVGSCAWYQAEVHLWERALVTADASAAVSLCLCPSPLGRNSLGVTLASATESHRAAEDPPQFS